MLHIFEDIQLPEEARVNAYTSGLKDWIVLRVVRPKNDRRTRGFGLHLSLEDAAELAHRLTLAVEEQKRELRRTGDKE